MSAPIRCFMLEETKLVRLMLRRFTFSEATLALSPINCTKADWGHEAWFPFPAADGEYWPARLDGDVLKSYDDVGPPHDDPRWPTRCERCGEPIPEKGEWQVFQDRVYRRVDTGEMLVLRDAPPGAMWDGGDSWHHAKGPDGISLHVALPPNGGDDYWCVDGPANNGPGWTRTGTVPNITARPSILTKRYHGYLTDGFLVEC